jgi:DNA invertase Pin-like site-specific DNA recombinase
MIDQTNDRANLTSTPQLVRPAPKQGAIADQGELLREAVRTARQVFEETLPKLQAILDLWLAELPAEAATSWRQGGVYIRESTIQSVAAEAAETQLRATLAHLTRKRVYIATEQLYFDVASATTVMDRHEFQKLYEEAVAGRLDVVAYFGPDRAFRNLKDSTHIKAEFRKRGIELEYLGKWEGDSRNPSAWQLETMQDVNAAAHARNTSHYVGTKLEDLTRSGRPVGRHPEVFVALEYGPSFMGRRGRVTKWGVQKELADVLREGCRRYIDGATLAEVAEWGTTTALGGVTPAKRIMNSRYWYRVLMNPKYAGHHMPTEYQGFMPGVESPPRPRRTRDSKLIPCVYPALWSIDDYYEMLRLARSRWLAPKDRKTYNAYLLSGIATDANCGHRVAVVQHGEDGTYWMGCRFEDTASSGRHAKSWQADVAAGELDALIAGMSFEDPDLLRQIEEELDALASKEELDRETFRPDPGIAPLRQALAALKDVPMERAKRDLEEKLAELEDLDVDRKRAMGTPVQEFRRGIEELSSWSEVWMAGDTRAKNKLLREAGVGVVVGTLPGEKRKPAHLISITATNPAFAVALAAALAKQRISSLTGLLATKSPVRLVLSRDLVTRALASGWPAEPVMLLTRPPTLYRLRHLDSGCEALTVSQIAEVTNLGRDAILGRIRRGEIAADKVGTGRLLWLIPVGELDRVAVSPELSPELEASVREAVKRHAMTTRELAKRSGISRTTIDAMAWHGHRPRAETVAKLARVLFGSNSESPVDPEHGREDLTCAA